MKQVFVKFDWNDDHDYVDYNDGVVDDSENDDGNDDEHKEGGVDMDYGDKR